MKRLMAKRACGTTGRALKSSYRPNIPKSSRFDQPTSDDAEATTELPAHSEKALRIVTTVEAMARLTNLAAAAFFLSGGIRAMAQSQKLGQPHKGGWVATNAFPSTMAVILEEAFRYV